MLNLRRGRGNTMITVLVKLSFTNLEMTRGAICVLDADVDGYAWKDYYSGSEGQNVMLS